MNDPASGFYIGKQYVGNSSPTFFIADIGANHDGDLSRAKDLIRLAKQAGADAVKFQHFKDHTIVSDYGFRILGNMQSHQAKWNKSVAEVYRAASLNAEWTKDLKDHADKFEIEFFTSPYAFDLVDYVDPYVTAFKIGSGDITWLEIIRYIASKGKPYIIASGAATMDDVERAISTGIDINNQIALLQCNTNYTGSIENFKSIQLNVLKSFRAMYPNMILGISDHTPGHAVVLGAVALGARIVEKHFTDDVDREGPDHAFAMDPTTWRDMVDRTRELEFALGSGVKKIESNEKETVVVQRRSIRTSKELTKGQTISREDTEMLRPCPQDALPPYMIESIIGRKLTRDMIKGEHFTLDDFKS